MRLKANDYGVCRQPPGATRRERNGKTSSSLTPMSAVAITTIWSTKPRYAITTPQGEFDSLAIDTPVVGQHTSRSGMAPNMYFNRQPERSKQLPESLHS